jgi:hypothetical protein
MLQALPKLYSPDAPGYAPVDADPVPGFAAVMVPKVFPTEIPPTFKFVCVPDVKDAVPVVPVPKFHVNVD